MSSRDRHSNSRHHSSRNSRDGDRSYNRDRNYKSDRSRRRDDERDSYKRRSDSRSDRNKHSHSRSYHRDKYERSRSRDYKSRDSPQKRSVSKAADVIEEEPETFRFDSPPREYLEYKSKVWDIYNQADSTDYIHQIQRMASTLPSSKANKIDRELYIGNLPSGITIGQLTDILNSTLKSMELVTGPGDPIISTWISNDGHYAFIEFRSIEEAKLGKGLDNVNILGQPLKVGKPISYAGNQPPTVTGLHALSTSAVGMNKLSDDQTAKILGGKGKLILTGLPHGVLQEEAKELLEEFGPLKAFDMPKDPITGLTRGYVIFDYKQDNAVAAVLGQGTLRISGVVAPVSKVGKDSLAKVLLPPTPDFDSRAKFTSRIMVLKNMIRVTDLENEDDYAEIHDDVIEECNKYGRVVSIVIPQPGVHTSGIGKIFVEFPTVEDACMARTGLEGMMFNGKRVECGFHPEELYFQGNFVGE